MFRAIARWMSVAAPDETVAAKVVVIIRSFGHAETETWTALPWERFESLIPA